MSLSGNVASYTDLLLASLLVCPSEYKYNEVEFSENSFLYFRYGYKKTTLVEVIVWHTRLTV